LRDGALAGIANHLVGGSWRGLNVDFLVDNMVLVEEAFCLAQSRTTALNRRLIA